MLIAFLLLVSMQLAPSLTASSPELRISQDEFRKLYDNGQVVVLDTRGEGAYRAGHMPGAEWLPLDAVEARIPALKQEKRTIITYCS